jgi:hypothetical protein
MASLPSTAWKVIKHLGVAATAAQVVAPVLKHAAQARSTVNYPGHIPLSSLENAFLVAGSAVVGVMDTKRGGKPGKCQLDFEHNPALTWVSS